MDNFHPKVIITLLRNRVLPPLDIDLPDTDSEREEPDDSEPLEQELNLSLEEADLDKLPANHDEELPADVEELPKLPADDKLPADELDKEGTI